MRFFTNTFSGPPPWALLLLSSKPVEMRSFYSDADTPIALLHGTDVDDVVAGYDLAAPGTTGLLRLADLDSLHRH
jgi:hypothetical protein